MKRFDVEAPRRSVAKALQCGDEATMMRFSNRRTSRCATTKRLGLAVVTKPRGKEATTRRGASMLFHVKQKRKSFEALQPSTLYD